MKQNSENIHETSFGQIKLPQFTIHEGV